MRNLYQTMRYFNDWVETRRSENQVPHLEQEGGSYFITFRLADSLPQELLHRIERDREIWLSNHPKPWCDEVFEEYHRKFSMKIEEWLDAGMGACSLRPVEARGIVEASLLYGAEERYDLHSVVVMPNHLHVLLTPNSGWTLARIVGDWKRHTARQINELNHTGGAFWARSYYDRLIRDPEHLERVVSYIRRNPEKAKLGGSEFSLWESEGVKALPVRG